MSKLSVQKINDLAGVSNKSALYYHFKSKWGLFEAALHYVLNPYVTNCLHELDKISTNNDVVEVNDIVQALLKPMVKILLSDNGIHHL